MPEPAADTAPAKLLLFGEHTVLHGSSAYAVPLDRFGMRLTLGARPGDPTPFADWLADARRRPLVRASIDLDAWAREADRLAVSSTIPQGYGLGSSGALVALVYRRYARGGVADLRALLGELESFFHGSSSGLDPLVSCLAQPVRVTPDGRAEPVGRRCPALPLPDPGGGWFLLDSTRTRSGQEAIARFRESGRDEGWRHRVLEPLVSVVDGLVGLAAAGSTEGLTPKLAELSRLQLEGLEFLIPDAVAERWSRWLTEGVAYVKLCGAGGGGYFLGYAPGGADLDAGRLPMVWL